MVFFSAFKALLSRRDKRTSNASSLKSKKKGLSHSNGNQQHNNNKYAATNSPVTSTTNSSSHNGHSFQFKDGRRYHSDSDVAYVLPNDDDEADRVHQQHWILRYALQSNYQAPVTDLLEKGITVLDSGCGPATWTFEMGEAWPNSTFHGIDASCVFPENIKPANVEFVIGNIAKQIPYPDNTFDYIHQRLLLLGLTNEDWDNALKELYRVLKPGGYIELAEPDLQDLENMGPTLKKLQYTMSDMLISRNMPTKVACEIEDRLIKAGFVNTNLKMTPLKLNHTDKAGKLLWDDYKHGYMNMRPVMAQMVPEWQDPEVYECFVTACGVEAEKNRANVNWYAYYAQKPAQ
ncbi:methyltransferase type 11 [Mucor ambiguus]|uniref:Methyltransferase type 11 n=1 Tax=Mucor ambiguus TaxID=91626 RepID=A0A0C9M773_9FUNG|nr:methyltransferase type 11 [Mucor ambiguus]